MSSKLREDLPTHGDWSRRALELFNKHRSDYKDGVAKAKSFYGERAFIADGESVNMTGTTRLILMMIEQGAKSAQLLMKHQTDEKCQITITQAYDVVTAFYVPEDVQWLKVIANGNTIGKFYGKYTIPELEDILLESWTLPRSEDEDYLEYILWISRQGKLGFVHNQEETIEIDGVQYRRCIFMQPMLPIVQCAFIQVFIETSNPCTVYLEVAMADIELRDKLAREEMTAWVEDIEDDIPLIIYKGGTFGKLYIKPKDRKLQAELPPVNLPNASLDLNIELPRVDLSDLDGASSSLF